MRRATDRVIACPNANFSLQQSNGVGIIRISQSTRLREEPNTFSLPQTCCGKSHRIGQRYNMAKRKSYSGDGVHAGKKQKTNHVHEAPTSEEVHTGRQLRHLLTFEQDLRKARHGKPEMTSSSFARHANPCAFYTLRPAVVQERPRQHRKQ